MEAELVYFRSVYELSKALDESLVGKIAFVDGEPMVKSQTGAGYGPANQRRRVGWQHAERAGAKALVVRSVGSSSRRFAHTGMMSAKVGDTQKDETWARIPVMAISNPDADQLRRLHKQGENLSLTLQSEAGFKGEVTSGNVILDLVGREKPEEIVLIGAHLDSWDLGTGAIDDGAGVAITTAAAALIAQLPQRPRRTLRVVMFGAEEVGLLGARAYARRHADEASNHVLATESDFGAERIWQLVSNVNPQANPAIDAIARLLSPLNIVRGGSAVPGGGPDIIPLALLGIPTLRLNQNGPGLLRSAPHRGRHARQNRPAQTGAERRGLRGAGVAGGRTRCGVSQAGRQAVRRAASRAVNQRGQLQRAQQPLHLTHTA